MRRSRFAKASDSSVVSERASIAGALFFDVKRPESNGEESLIDWRLAGLELAPLLLGFTHLLIAATTAVLSPSFGMDSPLVPAAIVILLDGIAATLLFARNRLNLPPHKVIRGLSA